MLAIASALRYQWKKAGDANVARKAGDASMPE
jgi:hypothetical protein